MHLHKIIISISTLVLLASCVFVPETSKKQKYSDTCNMFTRQLTLSANEINGQLCTSNDSAEACLMIYGVIIPIGSFVVSGSIVLIGNTLHWLEYQGSCSVGNA